MTNANGNTVSVTGYDPLGNITGVTDGGDTFTYTYQRWDDGGEKLVSAAITRGGATIQQADYTYYGQSDQGKQAGDDGDPKQVRVYQDAGTGGGLREVNGSYYGYAYERDQNYQPYPGI